MIGMSFGDFYFFNSLFEFLALLRDRGQKIEEAQRNHFFLGIQIYNYSKEW